MTRRPPPPDARFAIAALVLNFHQHERTVRFLRALTEAEPSLVAVFVVDNSAPTELTASDFATIGVPVHLLTPGLNLGVAGGRNIGIEAALHSSHRWDYLAILDNDLIVPHRSVEQLASAVDERPQVGIAGPCVLDASSPKQIVAAGGRILPLFYPRYQAHGKLVDAMAATERQPTAFVQGGAAVYRRSLFEQRLRFDERYNPYGPEDIDFCLAATAAGFCVLLVPDVRILHEGHGAYKTTLDHQLHVAAGDTLLRLKWAQSPYISVSAYVIWKLLRGLLLAPWREKGKSILGVLLGARKAIQDRGRPFHGR